MMGTQYYLTQQMLISNIAGQDRDKKQFTDKLVN